MFKFSRIIAKQRSLLLSPNRENKLQISVFPQTLARSFIEKSHGSQKCRDEHSPCARNGKIEYNNPVHCRGYTVLDSSLRRPWVFIWFVRRYGYSWLRRDGCKGPASDWRSCDYFDLGLKGRTKTSSMINMSTYGVSPVDCSRAEAWSTRRHLVARTRTRGDSVYHSIYYCTFTQNVD